MASPTRRQFIRSTMALVCGLQQGIARASSSFLDTPVVHDAAGRLLVPAYVNGHGPYRFMVDTGASHCSIGAPLAARLKLPPSTASAVVAQSLETGSLRMEQLSLPIVAEPDLLGVIGANALVGKQLRVDIDAGRLVIAPSLEQSTADSTVSLRQRFGGLLLADGKVDALSCKFILDTGAQRSIGNLALARRLGVTVDLRAADPLIVRTPDASVVAASTLPPLPIRIGGGTAVVLPIACAQLPVFASWELAEEPAVLLGMDYFSHLASFAIDYRHSTLSIRQR